MTPHTPAKIPLALKLFYTAFMCVLVPVYWRNYGPQNFLFFCDIALFVTVAALWLESPLLASTQAVGILIPQLIWMADFLAACVGVKLTGATAYMFDPGRSLFLRGLSFFHFWLPILLVWLVWRLGYDRRAFLVQTVLAWIVLVLSYLLTDPPPPPADWPSKAVNVNYVYGFPENQVQTWTHELVWLALLMAFYPICIHLPAHLLLAWLFGRRTPAARLGEPGASATGEQKS
jgi:hypothetical protein